MPNGSCKYICMVITNCNVHFYSSHYYVCHSAEAALALYVTTSISAAARAARREKKYVYLLRLQICDRMYSFVRDPPVHTFSLVHGITKISDNVNIYVFLLSWKLQREKSEISVYTRCVRLAVTLSYTCTYRISRNYPAIF